ncbi:hypothetical protein [Acinetobacter sp.]|jgi:hypothetical protein|uniref:hypothetical protein n=1 Tax=Acinetobacter sp. TaxID=472 RepID=UPI0028224249|nr:hypothetical protein [Acinetobacter sp.]MDR0235964.1 hypothetical protein [Acinetobacter sp.]MDR2279107.1 hypothetical protein [Vagococcus sp.]
MLFFETEKKIRKVIFDRKANENKSHYIEENADPEKVVADTLELLRAEIEKRKNIRFHQNKE